MKAIVALCALVGAPLTLCACFSVGRWEELPAADQDAFQRCSEAMRPTLCGPRYDTVYTTGCIRRNMGVYSETPAGGARQEWLLAHGCPPSMVNPSAYTHSSGGAQ